MRGWFYLVSLVNLSAQEGITQEAPTSKVEGKFTPECFIDSEFDIKLYPKKDYHTLYIAEIEKILIKE